jgi:transcriptional regulator with XRE-family HTH domain
MSPDQCRQARDILKWAREELAQAAGVSPGVVAALEEEREVPPAYRDAIRSALESVGIGFPFEIENDRARAAAVTYSPLERHETH